MRERMILDRALDFVDTVRGSMARYVGSDGLECGAGGPRNKVKSSEVAVLSLLARGGGRGAGGGAAAVYCW